MYARPKAKDFLGLIIIIIYIYIVYAISRSLYKEREKKGKN